MEIWRDVVGFDGKYLISSKGRLYSVKRGKLLEPKPNKKGYITTILYNKEGKPVNMKLHRMVAEAFISNPRGLPMVNHKDKNKANNSVDNLEWCDAQHNAEHSHARVYLVVTPEGKTLEVLNLNKFCKDNQLDQAALHRSLKTGHKHKGWKRIK